MNTQSTQQYHEFIRGFFTLFDEIKKEDDPIYNSRVGFNAVKFLIKHPIWNLETDEDKNKAYEVILPKQNKIKKAEQKLESEVKARLKEYVDDIAGVSIYGDHASITLGDDKKEFKISEFLNSYFCQKKGILGFSTLHSDGKSGMHGFVAEEEGKKIRHYVVTDGSYEMTLKWYAEGKECKIKIKIDANGVDLVKGDDFSLERLEVNRDVKIGCLFLHEIQFREKGQGKANEMQHNKDSNELSSETTTRIDINRGVSVQATDITQKKEEHHSHFGLQSNSRRQSYDSGIGKDFDDKINSQEAKEKRELRQAAREANSGGQVYNLQSLFEENPQNKKTPPPLPPRTSSLPPEKGVFDEQGGAKSGSQKPDDLRENEQISNNRQKGATSDSSDSSTFTKSVIYNQDNTQEDERYDNPTFTTFGHAVPGSRKSDESEQISNNGQKGAIFDPTTTESSAPVQDVAFKKVKDAFKYENAKESRNTGNKQPLNDVASILAWKAKNELLRSESEYDEEFSDFEDGWSDNEDEYITLSNPQSDYKQEKDYLSTKENEERENDKQKETRDKLQENGLLEDSSTDIKTNDSCYLSSTHTDYHESQVNSEESKKSSASIAQRNLTPFKNFLKEIRDRPKQHNKGFKEVNFANKQEQNQDDSELQEKFSQERHGLKTADQKKMSEETKKRLREVGLLKNSLTNVKMVEILTASVSTRSSKSRNDSCYSSPTHTDHHEFQVDPKQLKASLMNVEQSDGTKFTSKFNQENQKLLLKPVNQNGMSEQTKEHLLAAGLLKDNAAETKINDSGYSSPTYTSHYNFQINPEQLEKRLETIEPKDKLEKLNKGLREPSRQATKDLFSESMLEEIKESKRYDPVRKLLERKVAEQENDNIHLTIDKNSELYKLLEKDVAQSKFGEIEEDTLTEHIGSPDRNRVALANKNRKLLWTKHIADKKEKNDGISI